MQIELLALLRAPRALCGTRATTQLMAEQSHLKAPQSPVTEILQSHVGGIQVGFYGIEI